MDSRNCSSTGNADSSHIRQQNSKFIATEAADHICLAQALPQQSGKAIDDVIADWMTVGIIDLLK